MKISRENKKRKGDGNLGKFSSTFPLLVKRQQEYGFEVPSFQPRGSAVVVWRLPPIERPMGTIYVVDEAGQAQSPHVKGVLIAWGPKAMDSLSSEGFDLGQIVIFKRFAGWETNDQTPEVARACRILMLEASDIIGSDDLREQLESGKASYIKDESGRHNLAVKQISDKKAKILRLAQDPGATPAERATAKRLASKIG
jgi:co-chaperonin GroES (HSP10)